MSDLKYAVSVFALLVVAPARPISGQDFSTPSYEIHRAAEIAGEGPDYFLTAVALVAFAPSGNIVLYDRGELSVLEFDSTGVFIRRMGREGGGPGEFLAVNRIGFLGDSLWVVDYRQHRVTWFLDGDDVKVQTAYEGEGGLPAIPATFLDDGKVITLLGNTAGTLMAEMGNRDGTDRKEFAYLPSDLTVKQIQMGERVINAFDPFSQHALSATSSDGSGVAFVARPRPKTDGPASFTIVQRYAGTTMRRNVTYQPRPVPDWEVEILDSNVAQVAGQWVGTVASSRLEIERAYERGFPVPDYALPAYDAAMGTRGDLWLQVGRTDNQEEWIVYEALHEAFRVQLPPGESLMAVAGDKVATMIRNDLDVPSIRIYRVEASRAEGR